jgi:hypothetical protein
MADSDNSLYTLRYNQATQGMEAFGGGSPQWTPLSLSGGSGITQLTGDVTAGPGSGSQMATVVSTAAVKTLHADSSANLTGNVQLISGTNITLSQVGQAITINASSGGSSPNVVSHIDTTGASTTSTTPQPTTATVTITPSSSSAKIKISVSGSIQTANPTNSPVHITLLKDGTDVSPGNGLAGFFDNGSVSFAGVPASFVWLDAPGDTSPHIYTVALYNADATTEVRWLNDGSDPAGVIIAEEIH